MTASATHSTALAAIEAALEVEAAATPGPWGYYGHSIIRPAELKDGRAPSYSAAYYAEDARAIVLARSIVRRSLLNAKETLEQHRPMAPANFYCTGLGHRLAPWPCPDAARALALVNDIPEGGAK